MALLTRASALLGARRFAGRHPGPIHGAVDKLAGLLRGRVPERHAGKVDKGASLTKRALTGAGSSAPDTSEDAPTG
jgi:hypothetical protein